LRLLILFSIVGGISWLVYVSGLWGFFTSKQRLISFLDSLGPFAVIGFILLQVLQVVVAPIPGEVTGLIGGYVFGPVTGIIWSTIGLTLGSYIAFALARVFGRPFVERFVEKSIIKRFDYLLHHKGAFLVFLLFLIPGIPKDYLCYILGLGHLTTAEFLVIGGVGRLFGTILLTVGGDLIRHHRYEEFSILAVITIIVILLAMLFKSKLERLFRMWHITSYKKKKTKQIKRSGKHRSAEKQSLPEGKE
jgi:uncharacterized membrane protein YdjX (TVP38/TMEM64 family)